MLIKKPRLFDPGQTEIIDELEVLFSTEPEPTEPALTPLFSVDDATGLEDDEDDEPEVGFGT